MVVVVVRMAHVRASLILGEGGHGWMLRIQGIGKRAKTRKGGYGSAGLWRGSENGRRIECGSLEDTKLFNVICSSEPRPQLRSCRH
jgi:hypothetical protein